MALIFAESLVSLAVTATAFSRRTALSFTQLSQMPAAHAARIAAKTAALRVEYNHASRRRPTSFIPDFSANAAGLSVRFEAPRKPRSDKTDAADGGILMPNSTRSIDFFTWPG